MLINYGIHFKIFIAFRREGEELPGLEESQLMFYLYYIRGQDMSVYFPPANDFLLSYISFMDLR